MSTIKELDVDLGIKSDRFVSQGKKAQRALDEIERKARQAVAPLDFSKAFSGLDRIKSHLGEMLSRGPALVAEGLTALAAAAAASGVALTKAGLDRIDAIGDQAQALGVTTAALSELGYAARLTGSADEDLSAALAKMNQNLGDALLKANPTSEALARFDLAASSLAKDSPDEAFRKIVAGFESIPSPIERASLAMDIFGKGGVRILNTLGAGSAELSRLAEEARKLGVSVSSFDLANVAAAKDSLDRAGAAVEGLSNRMAVTLAPTVAAVSDQFVEMFLEVREGASAANNGLIPLAGTLATTADLIPNIASGIQIAGANIAGFTGHVFEAWGSFTEKLANLGTLGLAPGWVDKNIGDMKRFGEGMRDEAAKARKGVDKALNAPTVGEQLMQRLKKFQDEVDANAKKAAGRTAGAASALNAKSISDVTDRLKEQIATYGMGSREIERYKLATSGATEAQLAEFDGLTKKLTSLEDASKKADEWLKKTFLDPLAAAKKLKDEMKGFADNLKESLKTPLQKVTDQVNKINQAFANGAIDARTREQGILAAYRDSPLAESPRFAGAVEIGSTDARSAILQAMAAGRQPTSAKDVVDQLVQANRNLMSLPGGIARVIPAPAQVVAIN